eukprot:4789317-Prymnesium_polylepis.6
MHYLVFYSTYRPEPLSEESLPPCRRTALHSAVCSNGTSARSLVRPCASRHGPSASLATENRGQRSRCSSSCRRGTPCGFRLFSV